MCHQSLAVGRGIKFPRVTKKEERLKPNTPQRSEILIEIKKNNRLREARRREVKENKARRSQAKKVKAGMKNLRQQGLIH